MAQHHCAVQLQRIHNHHYKIKRAKGKTENMCRPVWAHKADSRPTAYNTWVSERIEQLKKEVLPGPLESKTSYHTRMFSRAVGEWRDADENEKKRAKTKASLQSAAVASRPNLLEET